MTIPDDDFQRIYLCCIHDKSRKTTSPGDAVFLTEWYSKDNNAVPPEWCLLPRTDEYKAYTAWEPVEKRLTAIFHTAHQNSPLSPERYLYSATHQEIFHGLLNYEGAHAHVFSFNRDIEGLPKTAPGRNIAKRFSDYQPDGALDRDAMEFRTLLREQIQAVLPAHHIQRTGQAMKRLPSTRHILPNFASTLRLR